MLGKSDWAKPYYIVKWNSLFQVLNAFMDILNTRVNNAKTIGLKESSFSTTWGQKRIEYQTRGI